MGLFFARTGGAAGVRLRVWKYGLGKNRLARTALASIQVFSGISTCAVVARASEAGSARTNGHDAVKAERE